eukprot:m.99248 g.99248  ORF g.99248 m.99248 type:complete len:80 (-) comp12453_c0_seq3:2384-2623(-)
MLWSQVYKNCACSAASWHAKVMTKTQFFHQVLTKPTSSYCTQSHNTLNNPRKSKFNKKSETRGNNEMPTLHHTTLDLIW